MVTPVESFISTLKGLNTVQAQRQEIEANQRMADRGDQSVADLLNFKMKEAKASQEERKENLLADLSIKAQQGDQTAISRLVALHPKRAKLVFDAQEINMQREAESSARLAADVIRAPEELKPQVYQQKLMEAKQMGIDISSMPQEYNRESEFLLNSMVASALPVEDISGPLAGTASAEELSIKRAAAERAARAEDSQQRLIESKALLAERQADLARVQEEDISQRIAGLPDESQSAIIQNLPAAARKEFQKLRGKDIAEKVASFQSQLNKLPELNYVVSDLKDIADKATYTTIGQAYDFFVKEAGFGSTEGSIARTKFGAIVDNQILPLLRDTFGAQFTEAEGERLRRTLGDLNLPPDEKVAALEVFIEQKKRNIKSLGREINLQYQDIGLGKDKNIDLENIYDPETGEFK